MDKGSMDQKGGMAQKNGAMQNNNMQKEGMQKGSSGTMNK
jgi:hypothetical protein